MTSARMSLAAGGVAAESTSADGGFPWNCSVRKADGVPPGSAAVVAQAAKSLPKSAKVCQIDPFDSPRIVLPFASFGPRSAHG
jgi:hypothetical protein